MLNKITKKFFYHIQSITLYLISLCRTHTLIHTLGIQASFILPKSKQMRKTIEAPDARTFTVKCSFAFLQSKTENSDKVQTGRRWIEIAPMWRQTKKKELRKNRVEGYRLPALVVIIKDAGDERLCLLTAVICIWVCLLRQLALLSMLKDEKNIDELFTKSRHSANRRNYMLDVSY